MPEAFPIWLVPAETPLRPYRCGERSLCAPESSLPPRLAGFTYLGRAEAEPVPRPMPRRWEPTYRLSFPVPDLEPGTYKYVLFCDGCVDGPRGSLTQSFGKWAPRPGISLELLSAESSAGGGAGPWIGAGLLAIGLALGAGLIWRRRGAARPQAGRAA